MANHPKMIEHMRSRLKQGLTYRELGPEFGMSKSKAHRIARPEDESLHDKNSKKDLDES